MTLCLNIFTKLSEISRKIIVFNYDNDLSSGSKDKYNLKYFVPKY